MTARLSTDAKFEIVIAMEVAPVLGFGIASWWNTKAGVSGVPICLHPNQFSRRIRAAFLSHHCPSGQQTKRLNIFSSASLDGFMILVA
jgi:hypothetical protein